MMPFKVGDRVSWIGGIDYGRRAVRWHGVVVSVSCGIAEKFKQNDSGDWVEDGPRTPAAMVEAFPGQHGTVEDPRFAGMAKSPNLVKFDDLTLEDEPEEHCSDCGTQILGYHQCLGVPGGFPDSEDSP